MVDKKALDTKNSDRVEDALKRLRSGSDDAFEDLVLSERVYNDLDEDNIVLESFNVDVIKSYIPYSDRIYVTICPNCVDEHNIEDYSTLIETGSIVPILAHLSKSARYIALAAVVEFYNNNHIKLNAALFAASMSLGAGALGCGVGAVAGTAGGAVVTSAVAGIAGSKGLISGGPALDRAVLKVSNSLQPLLDKLIASYVGSSPMSVSILSLKKDIERAT